MSFPTADNKIIIIDNAAQKHLSAHPNVVPLLSEAIGKITIGSEETHFEKEVDLGRVIGVSALVETESVNDNELTLFAYRLARRFPSRIVKREGQPCSTVVIVASLDEKKQWILSTAFIGGGVNIDEPFYITDKSSSRFKDSLKFWLAHALAYDSAVMDQPFESTWQRELNKPGRNINA